MENCTRVENYMRGEFYVWRMYVYSRVFGYMVDVDSFSVDY